MKFKKRNIQIVDHSTGQTLDFPTFGKQAGEEAINELEQNVDNKIAELKSLVGTPLKASTASAMNNRDKIYVYTGNETGYTNGHWYYYDGSKWVDGGVYNSTAVETDKTLSVENVPADAKKTGDEINKLMSEIADKSDTVDMLKAFPTDTASVSVASFADGANVPVKSLIVNIDPVQSGSGDPSPTNVRPISGWDEVNVQMTGKNLWDGLNYTSRSYLTDTGDINTNNSYGYTDYIPVAPDSTYYVSGISGSNPSICWYDNGKNFIGGEKNNGAASKIISVPSNAHFIRVSFLLDNVDTLMVNYPATDHDYHPYNGQSINIQLGQTVYSGTLDAVSGELTIDRKLIEINGNCTRWASPTGDWIGANTQSVTDMQDGRLMNLICNILPSIDGMLNGWNIYAVDKKLYITLQKATVGDRVELVNAWLASNPVQVIYPLATPLTISLTPHEVTALLGYNNVWADTGDTAVEYRADPTLYLQRLTEPDADMVADSNIVSGQYFMVGNTLYKATANIASGGAITPNVNCTRKSLSEALNELNA